VCNIFVAIGSMVRRTIVFRCLLVACAVLPCVHFLLRRRTHVQADSSQTSWDSLASPSRSLPASFLLGTNRSSNLQRVSLVSAAQSYPDVTAVILNWSRLSNVVQIASLLCGPWLEDVVAEIVVWNNNPREISFQVSEESNLRTSSHSHHSF